MGETSKTEEVLLEVIKEQKQLIQDQKGLIDWLTGIYVTINVFNIFEQIYLNKKMLVMLLINSIKNDTDVSTITV